MHPMTQYLLRSAWLSLQVPFQQANTCYRPSETFTVPSRGRRDDVKAKVARSSKSTHTSGTIEYLSPHISSISCPFYYKGLNHRTLSCSHLNPRAQLQTTKTAIMRDMLDKNEQYRERYPWRSDSRNQGINAVMSDEEPADRPSVAGSNVTGSAIPTLLDTTTTVATPTEAGPLSTSPNESNSQKPTAQPAAGTDTPQRLHKIVPSACELNATSCQPATSSSPILANTFPRVIMSAQGPPKLLSTTDSYMPVASKRNDGRTIRDTNEPTPSRELPASPFVKSKLSIKVENSPDDEQADA
ncbi:hypothetical protein EK21DRAFT_92295 [Setomelanomma holmii]|uniref:Uncharacterized protein n=1 Tax=Setomelanomma holmii TaxID=210430 RepID=A0A9P4LIH0_9PLEO|nr:hypothetical protein EK21DRAFT_92295 [Setomelanomma holmii]